MASVANYAVATVTQVCKLSKSVKGLTLKVLDKNLSFKPGQWLDVTVPGIDCVSGYSMTSSPQLLQQQGLMNLAVKQSDHPITEWLFSHCTLGSEVNFKIGGDFFYTKNMDPLLLIAGGVGINPLYSILRSIVDDDDDEACMKPQEIQQIERQHATIRCEFFVSRENSTESTITKGRIKLDDIKACVMGLPVSNVRCYICGPPAMIDSMEAYVKDAGVTAKNTFSERWWSEVSQ